MTTKPVNIDVLCAGHACYDLLFSVKKHPGSDEKVFADDLVSCGGGPAANAAIAITRLGFKAAFAGYLGNDIYGDLHYQEFIEEQVNVQYITRGSSPTPLSTVIVKPDGKRALINYKGSTKVLPYDAIDFSSINTKVILLDGHEPELSVTLIQLAKKLNIPTVLDAGSLHVGTELLMGKVDYLVASEKFAIQVAGDVETALKQLATKSPTVVITLGEKGLIWQRGKLTGKLTAMSADIFDTTGAGDAFHGAFAAAVANNMKWSDILSYSSIAGTLCCTKMGARQGLTTKEQHQKFFRNT